MAKLEYKLEISGTIEVITGLHIGGSDIDLHIGGIDNEVAKHNGIPYIPGSSLSGKMRHLIAKAKGYKELNSDRGHLALLFTGKEFNENGNSVKINNPDVILATHTRLLIRDDYMLNPDVLIDKVLEDKAENTITRSTGVAIPRHIERVVSGTKFQLNMIMDIYEHDDVLKLCETLHLGINLLNNDYLGGSGSRGYGAVKLSIDNVIKLVFNAGRIIRTKFNEYEFKN